MRKTQKHQKKEEKTLPAATLARPSPKHLRYLALRPVGHGVTLARLTGSFLLKSGPGGWGRSHDDHEFIKSDLCLLPMTSVHIFVSFLFLPFSLHAWHFPSRLDYP